MKDPRAERPQLLDVLSGGPVGVTSHVEVERAREQMLPWLEEQVADLPMKRSLNVRRERRRQIAVWTGGLAMAAAALFALLLQAPDPKEGSPSDLLVSGAPTPPKATLIAGKLSSSSHSWTFGQELVLSGRLSAGPEGAALKAERGYQVELRPSATISFDRALQDPRTEGFGPEPRHPQELRIHEGTAKISVLPSPLGARLVVKAGDILLTVVKSAFTIEAHAGEVSCVRVNDGQVTVVRGGQSIDVGAGESFGCKEPQTKSAEFSVVDAPKKSASRTTLSQENALLSRALAAESRGDRATARRAYTELLSKYPRSAFAQDARAGLDRVSR